MDATGSERAALFGASENVPMSVVFAASYPERASGRYLAQHIPGAVYVELDGDEHILTAELKGVPGEWRLYSVASPQPGNR